MDNYIFIAKILWQNYNEEDQDIVVLQANNWSEAAAKIDKSYGKDLLKFELEIISDMSLIQIDETSAKVIRDLNTF